MNDIQNKENALKVASSAVDKQKTAVGSTATQLEQVKDQYLQCVIHAAALHEKSRRKKDAMQSLIIWAAVVAIGLIVLLIHNLVGIIYFGLVGLIAYIIHYNTKDSKIYNYNRRRDFFEKYAKSIAPADQLKWKTGSIDYSAPTVNGWKCSECGTQNTERAGYCVSCGTPKR